MKFCASPIRGWRNRDLPRFPPYLFETQRDSDAACFPLRAVYVNWPKASRC
ncbi:hypothetical protein SAMN04515617_12325 [Collimonas sp. OK242]|jgi:hypothetical protein|uniref:hypothetical protein n=1 Tax=Collimonas sp. OK242 TaxID=1798195 RepID=UPI00089804B4|nr:hypothetical protein [Collimonas sp. OK242]SDY81412.1 hypothetical protein SAMN04515617_12325 [Collimonas sp. OK242]